MQTKKTGVANKKDGLQTKKTGVAKKKDGLQTKKTGVANKKDGDGAGTPVLRADVRTRWTEKIEARKCRRGSPVGGTTSTSVPRPHIIRSHILPASRPLPYTLQHPAPTCPRLKQLACAQRRVTHPCVHTLQRASTLHPAAPILAEPPPARSHLEQVAHAQQQVAHRGPQAVHHVVKIMRLKKRCDQHMVEEDSVDG
eukprot:354489-Chlamydomonas_euryale.AAC.5